VIHGWFSRKTQPQNKKIYLSILQSYKENIRPKLLFRTFFNFNSFGRGKAFGTAEEFGRGDVKKVSCAVK
jgi:hypothetical protein